MKKWIGVVPTNCDLCKKSIQQVFVDGRTSDGRWAIMCPTCRLTDGPRVLGVGRGQKYVLNLGTKEWEKVSP